MQYCSSQHQILLPSQSHPQLGIVFALAPSLHSFWSYFSRGATTNHQGNANQNHNVISPHIHNRVCCFCFGSVSSFFVELFLHWSPVAYCVPTNLWSSSFSILSFCLLILFMGFSRQEYWSGLPFPSTVDHVLSEFSTMTHPSWVALNSLAHSFIELDKPVVHVIRLVSFPWLCFSVCLLWNCI